MSEVINLIMWLSVISLSFEYSQYDLKWFYCIESFIDCISGEYFMRYLAKKWVVFHSKLNEKYVLRHNCV